MLQRKKEEQAYVRRLEAQRQIVEEERQKYLRSFSGQMEILSMSCFVRLNKSSVDEIERNLVESPWSLPQSAIISNEFATPSFRDFESLNTDLVYRRAQNALSRTMMSQLEEDASDSESESDASVGSTPSFLQYHKRQSRSDSLGESLDEGTTINRLSTLLPLILEGISSSVQDPVNIRLESAAAAVSDGSHYQFSDAEKSLGENVRNSILLVTGLGRMANTYIQRLESSSDLTHAHVRMPYFLQVETDILVPMCRTLAALVKCAPGVAEAAIQVVRAHLLTIRVLRLDISNCTAQLRLLGDVLLEFGCSCDGNTLACKCVAENVELFLPSPRSLAYFIKLIWKRSRKESSRTVELRSMVCDVLVSRRAVSYLVIDDIDSPYPCQRAEFNKPRLCGVLAIPECGDVRPRSISRYMSFAEDPLLESPRNRQDHSRVRVRSVLGERRTSSMIKMRSKALVTIQRAARAFVSSGKARRSDSTCSGISNDNSVQTFICPPFSRPVSLDQLEEELSNSRASISFSKGERELPTLIEDWLLATNIEAPHFLYSSSQEPEGDTSAFADLFEENQSMPISFQSIAAKQAKLPPTSSRQNTGGNIDVLDLFLRSAAEEDDLQSAILLRCIQDDLLSRVYVRIRAREIDDSRQLMYREKSIEQKLMAHCNSLFSACLKIISRKVFLKKRESRPVVLGIACELIDRILSLSDVWVIAADYLTDSLLQLVSEPESPGFIRNRCITLLCMLAKSKIVGHTVIDDQIENLLSGSLFSCPTPSETLETTDVFLEDLGRIPASPVHVSKAQALHDKISSLPSLRILTKHSKPAILEDVVRICAAAYLKHTRTTHLAYSVAYEEKEIDDTLVDIWRAAWQSTRSIVNAFRKSQHKACVECSSDVVEDAGMWRCEMGHVLDTFEMQEKRSYNDICVQVAARARILLSQEPAGSIGGTIHDILLHARRFVESSTSDDIDVHKLELYLKSKNRQSVSRDKGFYLLKQVLSNITRSDWGDQNEDMHSAMARLAANMAPSFGRTSPTFGRSSPTLMTKDKPRGTSMPNAALANALVETAAIFASMPRRKDAIGYHALDLQTPSPLAASTLKNANEVTGLLVDIAECSVSEPETIAVLGILKGLAFDVADYEDLLQRNILSRVLELSKPSSLRSNFVIRASWSLFTRMTIRIMNGPICDKDDDDDENVINDIKIVPLDNCFMENFHEIERSVGHMCHSEICRSLQSMEESVSEEAYEFAELNCYRFLCLLGVFCQRSRFSDHFASLCLHMEGPHKENLVMSLIKSASHRIQQLGLCFGRYLLFPCNPERIANQLFFLGGEWSLSTKASSRIDLAYQCAGLIRYLSAKYPETWKDPVMRIAGEAAREYLVNVPTAPPSVLYRMWTALAVFDIRAPCSLRPGTRVKVLNSNVAPKSAGPGEEYGIVLSTNNHSFHGDDPQKFCMIILDSEVTKTPIKYEVEKVIPVSVIPDRYKSLFAGQCYWVLDVIDHFSQHFFNADYQEDIVWCELKSMSMAVLHSWIAMDSSFAIKRIASEKKHIWHNIMSICARPVPSIELDNVDDLPSTDAAFIDFKAILCEFGTSPVTTSLNRKVTAPTEPPLVESSETTNDEESLLADPLLQPGKRAALARQASAQSFAPSLAKTYSNSTVDPYPPNNPILRIQGDDHQVLGRRNSATGSAPRFSRSYSSGGLINSPRHQISVKKRVTFESASVESLSSPFREIEGNDQSSYVVELQVERNRRRARGERKRRAARRLRTLSSSSVRENPTLASSKEGFNVCEPDTPRGRDAPTITLPVELPTVDTVLSVPMSTRNRKSISQRKNERAVVQENTRLRLSPFEVGVVKEIQAALNGSEVALVHVTNSYTGLERQIWCDIANLELSEDIIADKYQISTVDDDTTRHQRDSQLIKAIGALCTRSGILCVRRAAIAAISASVHSNDNMQLLLGEAGGAAKIFGMVKLCDSSSSNDISLSSINIRSFRTGSWDAISMLNSMNADFADMLLDEATLFLANTATDTLFYETPHPLCPDGNESAEDEYEEVSPPDQNGPPSNAQSSTGQSIQASSTGSAKRFSFDDVSNKQLRGSHRFHIPGASGMLVEFDLRCAIISGATQVTLSYDPQDREVIKVIGDGGADAWVPVVVCGNTCYLHWSVNQQDLEPALSRLDELNIDIYQVAWGVAVRVRTLDEPTNLEEKEVLKRPLGGQILKVLAADPCRCLSRSSCGMYFFETAIKYMRSQNLAYKPELCEVLTLIVQAHMKGKDPDHAWTRCIAKGLYTLHFDLLTQFDGIADSGFAVVSPYFVCLLELLMVSRELWTLENTANYIKAPLCSYVLYGKRRHSKVVVDCVTCGLVNDEAVCLACAAVCHQGHVLQHERTTLACCGCSSKGPDECSCLRPFADMWSISTSDRTWFDVVCQTADVFDCITGGVRQIPYQFMNESLRSCEDGKILRLCLRSLEECLRSEVQFPWWDREARHMWANMMDQGMDSVPEVAFGLKVLVSSLLPNAFNEYFKNDTQQKIGWKKRLHTNQSWVLAQAMLQFQFALGPSSCYPEWDSRVQNWVTTLEGIVGFGGGEEYCTFLLTGEFPRPQVYYKCKTCKMEICEYCANTIHLEQGHKVSKETFGPGFCDERTTVPEELQRVVYQDFSQYSSANFESLQKLYWMNHDPLEEAAANDDQVPTEPRTLAALLNVPHNMFQAIHDEELPSGMVACVKESSFMSMCLQGILIELLGIRDDSSLLVVGCDLDHGYAMCLGSILVNTCDVTDGSAVHGFASSRQGAVKVGANIRHLRNSLGVPIAPVNLFSGDLFQHIRDWKKSQLEPEVSTNGLIPGLLNNYSRILCTGVCTYDELELLSALLLPDGALLCPMVDTLKYGVYVQRNIYTRKCENRTLGPLYEESEKFQEEISNLGRLFWHEESMNDLDDDAYESALTEVLMTRDIEKMKIEQEELIRQASSPVAVEVWLALSEFANRLSERETCMLGFRDITVKSLEPYPLLQQEDIKVLQARFAILKHVNESLSEVIPLINLNPRYSTGSIGQKLSHPATKRLVFLSTKLEAWSKGLEPGWSEAPHQCMPSITVSRKLVQSGDMNDTLFLQTYNQVQNFPTAALKRRDQSFKVRFAGEGGHDVGGLYRDLFSEMCDELKTDKLPLLYHPQSMSKVRGTPLLPNPALYSPLDLRLLEFLGLLVGVACLRHGITFSLDFSPVVWKTLVNESLREADLRFVDDTAYQTVSFIRRAMDTEIEDVFLDTHFVIKPGGQPEDSNDGNPTVVELCPFGKQLRVSPLNASVYADLYEAFRLNEYQVQLNAVKRGLSPMIPSRLLPMFSWQELESIVCGVPDVDVEFLHSRTKYVGGVLMTDTHIKYFWDVLSDEFTPEDRTQFLRFVWGRERMSPTDEGSTFIIGPHLTARDSGEPDKWLPVAHTCFFSLDLPKYSSREITKSKLLFAMHNCNAIDADDTGEGHANMSINL